jgi:hypothetical protein
MNTYNNYNNLGIESFGTLETNDIDSLIDNQKWDDFTETSTDLTDSLENTFVDLTSESVDFNSENTEESKSSGLFNDKFSLDFDLSVLPGLETSPTDNLSGLSNDLLANSTLSTDTSYSLGELYSDPIEYGDPYTDANYWRQQEGAMSCAVVAQIAVYQSLTGEYISEYDASNYAYQQGWFDPNTGTQPEYVGHILEALNIDTYQTYDASLATLEYVLATGNKAIVGLDANEIWNPQYDSYGYSLEQENLGHAVWVTGINYGSDGSVDVILNDSGIANGSGSVVNYYDFANAWQDYNNFLTIADNPWT